MSLNANRTVMRHGWLQKKLSYEVILAVVLVFFVFFSMLFVYMINSNTERIVKDELQALDMAARQLNYMQSSVSSMARQIVVDNRVQEGVSCEGAALLDELINREEIKGILRTYANIMPVVESIMIYTGDEIYSTNRTLGISSIEAEPWFAAFRTRNVNSGYTIRHVESMEQGLISKEVISYVLAFREINSADNMLGVLIMNLDYSEFLSTINFDRGALTGWRIVDGCGNIVAGAGKVSVGYSGPLMDERIAVGGDIALTSTALDDGWIMMVQISGKAIWKSQMPTLVLVVLFCTILVCVLSLILRRTIHRITSPLRTLHDAALEIGKGNFDVRVNVDTNDELSDLADSMNAMCMDLTNLMNETVRYERLTKEMELNRLMLQIKPHFIYNTLNSIVYMAHAKGHEQIERFTKAFISLLQNTLSIQKDNVHIPLGRELDNIRNYIILQQYRYPDKFTLSIYCPDELLDSAVPNVLLQPLVENSIFHGLVPQDGAGKLSVDVHKAESDLIIYIADDGVGMSAEQVQKLRNSNDFISGTMHSIGFCNVCQRIEHIYGSRYGIDVDSTPGEGTLLTVRIPHIKHI